jgi:prepilin signal peptidase PulO-like enzyme (type II secretory pathway)
MILILGLCCGSFVNMLLYRTAVRYGLKKKIKTIDDKYSFCDFCGRPLNWYENIPAVSWIVQRGKTRCCKRRLPVSYPLIEIGLGMIFLLYLLIQGGNNLENIYANPGVIAVDLCFLTMLWFSTMFDFKYMILPDFATVVLFVLSVIRIILTGGSLFSNGLMGLAAVTFIGGLHLATKGKGMGMGDVKFSMIMGLVLGWPNVLVAFYVAFISGAIVSVLMLLTGKAKMKSAVPFGPYLILGTLVAWWWGMGLWKWVWAIG